MRTLAVLFIPDTVRILTKPNNSLFFPKVFFVSIPKKNIIYFLSFLKSDIEHMSDFAYILTLIWRNAVKVLSALEKDTISLHRLHSPDGREIKYEEKHW
jgi:hypothetical protein